jgi:hypothetical protein
MFPENTVITIEEQTEQTTKLGSFLFDFKTGQFVTRDGKLVQVDGIEAIKVWVQKVLRTEKDKFKAYENAEYGINLEDLIIGYSLPISFVESEISREITEALTKHSQIEDIVDFEIERNNSTLNVTFRVVLLDGDSFESEVSI